jgi:hypothetical protein
MTDEGELLGAWDRSGAARLASTIIIDPPSPPSIDVRDALEDVVSGL